MSKLSCSPLLGSSLGSPTLPIIILQLLFYNFPWFPTGINDIFWNCVTHHRIFFYLSCDLSEKIQRIQSYFLFCFVCILFSRFSNHPQKPQPIPFSPHCLPSSLISLWSKPFFGDVFRAAYQWGHFLPFLVPYDLMVLGARKISLPACLFFTFYV